MSAVDRVITSFDELEPPLRAYALVTDGDHTVFVPGETDMYPDVEAFITEYPPAATALVSADPTTRLAMKRADKLGAEVLRIPSRRQWSKVRLYLEAMRSIKKLSEVDCVIVAGDRWLMDVSAGKLAAWALGFEVEGVLIERELPPPTIFDRRVLDPLQELGYVCAAAVGADRLVRPRQH